MNDKFDELAKGLAQSVTRRQALRRFVLGMAGTALALLGLPNKAQAVKGGHGGGNKACNHCRYPYGCDKLPADQQAGCFTYCNGLCGSG
jgi:hypothetical protein